MTRTRLSRRTMLTGTTALGGFGCGLEGASRVSRRFRASARRAGRAAAAAPRVRDQRR